jgi:hypothetical protein
MKNKGNIMNFRRRDLLKVAGSSAVTLSASELLAARPAIHRDVCIIGGGSAGTYAALRLKDEGRSVAIVERSRRLGGHAETFYDPDTGAPIDIGVVIFPDNQLVRNYFGRFSVPVASPPSRDGRRTFVDFRTGKAVAAFSPSPAELGAALVTYFQLVTGPFAFLAANGFQLPSSGPLLDQLVQPFGQFAEQNGLTALLPLFFLYEQGFGSLLDAPTLYVLKNMGPDVIGGVLGGSFLTVPSGVSSLYESATSVLEGDVLFEASVTKVVRPPRGPAVVLVDTDAGPRVIHCEKLLVTAPPVLSNLCAFDLDRTESRLFGHFQPNFYWTGVVRTTGLAPDLSVVNAAANTPVNLAPLPGIYSLSPSAVPGLTNVKYGSSRALSDQEVRSAIRNDLRRVRAEGVGPIGFNGFATFKSHSPYALMVSPSDIRAGFYAAVQSLQGRRRTFYASATFQTHSSAAIWAFIEELLPALAA